MDRKPPECIDPPLCALAQPVLNALRDAKLSVVTAESCTGGLIAAILSHGSQASDCLHGGFIVYTKAQKTMVLGVDAKLLQSRGAVNVEVARQMAKGALQRSPADVAVSVTGVLGPHSDEDGNPPGLVYVAVGRRGQSPRVVERRWDGSDPEGVRRAVVVQAFSMLQQDAADGDSLRDSDKNI